MNNVGARFIAPEQRLIAPAPGWLVAEVAEGIQRLLVLRLDGCPPADAVEAVALAWADALMLRASWVEETDAPRLREGFRSLAAHATRWPVPAQFFEHLPPRQALRELPPPPPSAQDKERIRALLAAARARMKGAA